MFIDAHVHVSLNGDNAKTYRERLLQDEKSAEEMIRKVFLAYKQRGIYALRDGGDNLDIHHLIRRVAKEEGIIYRTPLYGIYKKGFYGRLIGKPVESIQEIDDCITDLVKNQTDFIKVALSGMMSFNEYGHAGEIGFSVEEFKHIIERAHSENLPVMVHVNTKKGIEMALKCGADSIEHGYYANEELLKGMKEKGTIWVPTLAPLGNIVYSNDERYKLEKKLIRKIFEEQCEKVKLAYDLGVEIAVGSDAGAYKVYHGSGFFDELIYLNKAGIKKNELMDMAFKNGMKALKITKKELNDIENRINEESWVSS
ncbi:amidohydrolase family protein [Alkalibacter mobilis]|uniref:amidohydrolase family protein n=1 Tax=Alkalibacter mobilis TaxID=2787712 RepID=UPI00189CA2AE|nr:amidohydrolase family protein [Alkalibacter mobilis]MBF7096887.1 amidohydrolase family protein [Alkalibacter mobilis]